MPEDDKKIPYNLPGNSKKSKEAAQNQQKDKNLTQITTGKAIERKKPLGRKVAETFVEGTAQSVGQYVLFDVILPAIKDLVVEVGTQALQKMFYGGGSRSGGGSSSAYRPGHTSYNTAYKRNDGPRELSQKARATHDFREIILETRAEAEEVIDRLNDIIQEYGATKVPDLYELVGITGSFTDEKYGWTDLRGSGVRRVRDGYLLELPQPVEID